jgi:hypothetical protein
MKMSVQGGYISQLMRYFLATLLLLCTSLVYAQDNLSAPLLTPEQAFAFSVESTKPIKRGYTGPFSLIIISININLRFNKAINLLR